MKAKEIAKRFTEKVSIDDLFDNPKVREDALLEVINQHIADLKLLLKARNAQTNEACIKVIQEINQKWNAVNTHLYNHYSTHILSANGFLKVLKDQSPMLYYAYQSYKTTKS